ncbi:unnamed protein product [Gordionus sp. m RMFG-2023]
MEVYTLCVAWRERPSFHNHISIYFCHFVYWTVILSTQCPGLSVTGVSSLSSKIHHTICLYTLVIEEKLESFCSLPGLNLRLCSYTCFQSYISKESKVMPITRGCSDTILNSN